VAAKRSCEVGISLVLEIGNATIGNATRDLCVTTIIRSERDPYYNKSAFSKPKSKKEINSKEGVNSENHYYLCVGIFELCDLERPVMGLTKVTLLILASFLLMNC